MIDEGYIKFDCDWREGPPLENGAIHELNEWRRALFEAGLIGQYEDSGVGFGNISVRARPPAKFIISGTQTGHIPELNGAHYAEVTDYDIARNRLACHGPIKASSESLTHAAIYELDPAIKAVVHVHNDRLWHELRGKVPTTDPEVAYGTPEMAGEFVRLYRETDFPSAGIAVMAGHESGLIGIGRELAEAARRFLDRDTR